MVNKNLTKINLKKTLIMIQLSMISSMNFGMQNVYPVNMPVPFQQQPILPQSFVPITPVQQPSTTFIIEKRPLNQEQSDKSLTTFRKIITNVTFLMIVKYISGLNFDNLNDTKDNIMFLFLLLSIIFVIISWKNNGFIFSMIYLFFSLYVLTQIKKEEVNIVRINFIIAILIILNVISFAFQVIKYLYKMIFSKSTITIVLIGLLIVFIANPNLMQYCNEVESHLNTLVKK
jgi:hypothetical protein